MKWISLGLIALILLVFLGSAIGAGLRGLREQRGVKRLVQALASVFMAMGAIGFFGFGISACGGYSWLGDGFEWPVGYATGISKLPDGVYVVPHGPADRIQVYDPHWMFLRGWHIEVNGGKGSFKVRAAGPGLIEAITSRGQIIVYDLQGREVSRRAYDGVDPYNQFRGGDLSHFVPTAWWLWPLTGPFYAWITMVGGGALVSLPWRKKAVEADDRGQKASG